jgi:hypothetical protein
VREVSHLKGLTLAIGPGWALIFLRRFFVVDNEEAVAELLYLMWAGHDGEPKWEDLPKTTQNKWLRTARFTLMREVDLAAKLAKDSYRKRFEQRLLERLARWEQGK